MPCRSTLSRRNRCERTGHRCQRLHGDTSLSGQALRSIRSEMHGVRIHHWTHNSGPARRSSIGDDAVSNSLAEHAVKSIIHGVANWFRIVVSNSEPLCRSDISGLLGFGFGIAGWMFGTPDFLTHFCAMLGGISLGQVIRDRQQRSHDRRLAQMQRDHEAAMAEIATMDFEALVLLSKHIDELDKRCCVRCGRTTYNPTDIKQGYCGSCHDRT